MPASRSRRTPSAARRAAASSAPASSTTTRRPPLSRARRARRRRSDRRAGGARRDRAKARAPALLGGGLRVGMDDQHRAPRSSSRRPTSRAAARISSRSPSSRASSAATKPAAASRRRARARARARPRRRSACSAGAGAGLDSPRERTRRRPTSLSATRSSIVVTPRVRQQRLLVGGRARGHRRAPGRCGRARPRLASRARAAARTTVGRPAPDSTAAVISSRAARSRPAVLVAALSVAAPDPDDAGGAEQSQPTIAART